MDFGEAIRALKAGEKVARQGWNGKGMWLGYVAGDQWGLGSKAPYESTAEGANLLPRIGLRTAGQGCFVPWLASQSDVLAEDWHLVTLDQPKAA